MNTLLSQVEHLGRLVDDLHTLSMADAGQLSLQKQRMDLTLLVAETLDQLHPSSSSTACSWTCPCPAPPTKA